jgi:pyruvate/2-oxoglutarate dehydrogenase complex dihydrolipoamide acyltransferase (E2) component
MRLVAVVLPDLGIGPGENIVVSHWFYRRGEEVWEGDRLVEVLVGAATFDVPAPATGRLTEIRCHEDDRVRPGQVLATLAVGDGSAAPHGA